MTTTTLEQYSSQIEQALRKSFNFGQTYWQQADSESIAQQNKSDETREKFNKFVDDIVFTLAPPTISEQSNPASALEQYKERCLRVADLLRKENHGWNSFSYTQAINDFSTAIAALPLPAMPEQAEPVKEKRAPVQGFAGGIPWDMHLRAYDAYCKKWSPQKALIEGGCRGGFGTNELDMFIPGWREELSERTALLARVAELEARITQVKDQFAKYESSANDNDIDMMFEYDELKKLIEG